MDNDIFESNLWLDRENIVSKAYYINCSRRQPEGSSFLRLLPEGRGGRGTYLSRVMIRVSKYNKL